MYQSPTNFGFTGSEVGALPTTLDAYGAAVNPAYYNQIADFLQRNGGRLASVCGIRLYDSLRVDQGVQPLRTFNFFQNGVNASQGLFVASGTTYVKQEIDVSPWIVNGMLAKGYEVLVWSIQVRVQLPNSLDESVQTSGNGISLPNDPGIISGEAATDPIKAGNLLRAIQESYYFELKVNSTVFEHGPTYGSGNAVAVGGTVSAPIADGMWSNSLGWCYQMPVMRHIPEQTQFAVRMTCQNPFTTANTVPFRVNVILDGIGIQPITG
jgi:hypothetical protein